eukprot:5402208-Amphidinium_carterae.1
MAAFGHDWNAITCGSAIHACEKGGKCWKLPYPGNPSAHKFQGPGSVYTHTQSINNIKEKGVGMVAFSVAVPNADKNVHDSRRQALDILNTAGANASSLLVAIVVLRSHHSRLHNTLPPTTCSV